MARLSNTCAEMRVEVSPYSRPPFGRWVEPKQSGESQTDALFYMLNLLQNASKQAKIWRRLVDTPDAAQSKCRLFHPIAVTEA